MTKLWATQTDMRSRSRLLYFLKALRDGFLRIRENVEVHSVPSCALWKKPESLGYEKISGGCASLHQ